MTLISLAALANFAFGTQVALASFASGTQAAPGEAQEKAGRVNLVGLKGAIRVTNIGVWS